MKKWETIFSDTQLVNDKMHFLSLSAFAAKSHQNAVYISALPFSSPLSRPSRRRGVSALNALLATPSFLTIRLCSEQASEREGEGASDTAFSP